MRDLMLMWYLAYGIRLVEGELEVVSMRMQVIMRCVFCV